MRRPRADMMGQHACHRDGEETVAKTSANQRL